MNRVRVVICHVAVSLAIASAALSAQAALVTYSGLSTAGNPAAPGAAGAAQAAFLGNFSTDSVRTQGFEQFAVGETFQGSPPPALTFAPTSGSTGTGTPGTGNLIPSVTGAGKIASSSSSAYDGRFNTTGGYSSGSWASGKWWEASNDFDILFSAGVSAFGFYLTDANDFPGQLDLVLTDGVGAETRSTVISGTTGTANGSLTFFGFVNDAATYTKVRFDFTQTAINPSFLGFDDLLIGSAKTSVPNPAPEPATLALVAVSLGALVATRRRTNSKA